MIQSKSMPTKTINLRDLPDDLVRTAKACAALHGMTLKGFVIKLLSDAIQKDIPAMPSSVASSVPLELVKRRRRAKGA
jgi:plasmid stability protein